MIYMLLFSKLFYVTLKYTFKNTSNETFYCDVSFLV